MSGSTQVTRIAPVIQQPLGQDRLRNGHLRFNEGLFARDAHGHINIKLRTGGLKLQCKIRPLALELLGAADKVEPVRWP